MHRHCRGAVVLEMLRGLVVVLPVGSWPRRGGWAAAGFVLATRFGALCGGMGECSQGGLDLR